MKIAYQDFEGNEYREGVKRPTSAAERINEWLAENAVTIINIETLILVDPMSSYGGVVSTPERSAVRVWYMVND